VISAVIGLVGCETIALGHVDAECVDKPSVSLLERLTDKQLSDIDDDTFNAIEKHIITYQENATSQCDLLEKHNRRHNER